MFGPVSSSHKDEREEERHALDDCTVAITKFQL